MSALASLVASNESFGREQARQPGITPLGVVLVDDRADVRRALRLRLGCELDLVVVGEAADGASALELVARVGPDVVVMDAAMPRLGGLEATTHVRAIVPDCRVVLLTLHDDPVTREQARLAGVAACVGKCEPVDVLLAAIRSAGRA